ncbi:hypothetical protein DBR32_09335 [Taibaiella sp. KBW10]|uniref:hypothetical protein n=1 Tax=Taibaiella sp. KBW10 TaxID=2153357 RepID=UPI000F5B84FA|nr:hypothetical protein [Taibaiella sp. KBW10]RQO30904.1 hypothetical protein DBR32_09335 [Taibaiella sp. KBW10]
MNTGLLHVHSLLRYLIIIVAIWAIIKAASGMSGGKSYTKSDQRPGLFYLIFMDLQLVVGLLLYVMGNFGIKQIQALGMGEVMKNGVARFFVMEHTLGMLLALILVHIGYANTKKAGLSDQKKFSKSFWCFLISFIVILASIPWPFRELGRGWMPGM